MNKKFALHLLKKIANFQKSESAVFNLEKILYSDKLTLFRFKI